MKKNVEDYLREYFKQEWREDEIRKALCIIQEVLLCHDTDDPYMKHDHEIALALTDEEVVEDIVKEYSKNVPHWTEEALKFANDHDVGVWRSLYDAIVPSLRFARRLGTKGGIKVEIVKNRVYHVHCVDNEYVFLGIASGMTKEGAYKFIDWFNPKVTWVVDPTNINQEMSHEVKKDCKAVRRYIKHDGSISE